MVTEDRSRGQIILVGAIALAFIILGVVVVFNGVLYTETLSSGSSSQSASTADVASVEVEQSVGCLLTVLEREPDSYEEGNEDEVASEIRTLSDHYQETNARSKPAVVAIEVEESDIEIDDDDIEHVSVTVAYDSHDLSYTRDIEEIEPATNCLGGSP